MTSPHSRRSTTPARPRRGEVLRHVGARLDEAATSADATALLDLAVATDGVEATFADEVDLVGALLLRWRARLSAELERALAREPRDLPAAVARAWASTAAGLPGVRALVDAGLHEPGSPAMAALLERARRKEQAFLARAAGTAAGESDLAVSAGARLERAARALRPPVAAAPTAAASSGVVAAPTGRDARGLARRLRAMISA